MLDVLDVLAGWRHVRAEDEGGEKLAVTRSVPTGPVRGKADRDRRDRERDRQERLSSRFRSRRA